MTILQSLKDWIENKQSEFTSLTGVSIVLMGDDDDLSPPFLGLMESGSELHETEGFIFPDTIDYQVTAELHTIPASESEGGTPADDAREMRRDAYEILKDCDALAYMDELNDWKIFDIRVSGPTSDASDGRLITRWNLTTIARAI